MAQLPHASSPWLLIVGASVRAAAQSAMRASYCVWGADLFADADLCNIATATSLVRYPAGLLAELARAPMAPWIYTGALENYPALLQRSARLRTCWGNSANVVRQVRNPLELAKTLPRLGVSFPVTFSVKAWPNACQQPAILHSPESHSPQWLLKPKHSGGGSKVAWLYEDITEQKRGSWFVQQHVHGLSCSAVYVAAAGRAVLLGATRQLLGTEWLNTSGFTYSGSVGPVKISEKQTAELQHIGNVIAEQFGLVGLFGVDLVQLSDYSLKADQHEFVVIEINPRYTASVEVLERSLGCSALAWHATAFTASTLPAASEIPAPTGKDFLAKGILFARQNTSFHAEVASYVNEQNSVPLSPAFADIPHVDSPIACGAPVLTLFAAGSSEAAAVSELRRAVTVFEKQLYRD